MCFGATTACTSCSLQTTYLVPGITRCPFRLKPIHPIVGPTITVSLCWRCRPRLPGASDEVKRTAFWYYHACTFLGVIDALDESNDSINALETEITSAEDEGVKDELRGIKEAEEVKKREVEGAIESMRRWRHDKEAPILVSRPPHRRDEPSPLTFSEWTSKFGFEARGQEDQEAWEAWEALEFFDCNDYELYLEANDYESQLDGFRAKLEYLGFLSRKRFDFEPVLIKDSHPNMRVEDPRALGLLSFREWKRKERLGAIKWSEEKMKAHSKAERSERDRNLYGEYVKDKSESWGRIWYHWRTEDTANLRRGLSEKWNHALDPEVERPELEADPTEGTHTASEVPRDNEEPTIVEESRVNEETTTVEEAPAQPQSRRTMGDSVGNTCAPTGQLSFDDGDTGKDAEVEENTLKEKTLPMNFEVWCASPLAPQNPDRRKNSYSALRSDLRAYTSYLGGYSHRPSSHINPDPIRSAHFALRQRLEFFQRNRFNHIPLPLLNTPPGSTIQPLSLAEFRKDLEKKGFKLSTTSGWVLEAYTFYLSLFEEGTVQGFFLVLDWWAREDRRELCGLPRSDPLTTKLTAMLRYLVKYIISKDKVYRVAAQQNLSCAILILNSCMDKGLEPTAEQLSTVREAYKRAKAIEATMRVRAETMRARAEEDEKEEGLIGNMSESTDDEDE